MKQLARKYWLALVAGLAFSALGSLWASSGPGQVEALTPKEEALAERVAQAYEPFLRELIKPVYVYNYVPKSDLGLNPLRPAKPSDQRVSNHLKKTAQYFWSSDRLGGNYSGNVAGLYVALDPLSSSGFGGSLQGGWLLYRIELPKGLRYIDTRKTTRVPMDDSLASELRSVAGWTASIQNLLLSSQNGPMARALANRVMQKLHAAAFLYDWNGKGLPPACGENNTEGAFVLVDTSTFERNFRVFSSLTEPRYQSFAETMTGTKDGSSRFSDDPTYQEARMMSAAIDVLERDNPTNPFAFRPVQLNTDDLSQEDVIAWFQDHIFNCGGEEAWARPVMR